MHFSKKKCEHYKIINVYLIFEFRRIRDLNVNQNLKCLVIQKICFIIEFERVRDSKRNIIVIESIDS